MNRKLVFFYIAAALLSLVGAVFGLLVGAQLGGNAILIADYAGLDGYESTGLFGAVVGASLFCLLCTLLFWKKAHTKTSLLLAVIGCLIGGVILYVSVGYIAASILLYGWTFPSLCLLTINSFVQLFQKTAQ